LIGVACASAFVTAGLPAFAEGVGGFTVIGQNEPANNDGLSETISYGDLDLTTQHGQAMLRHRVWNAAEDLCARLGEGHLVGESQVGSCEQQAFFDATRQLHAAIARATVAGAPAYPSSVAATGSNLVAGAPSTGLVLIMRVGAAR
jgi:UrcA family protein